jgi:hypothetical protein
MKDYTKLITCPFSEGLPTGFRVISLTEEKPGVFCLYVQYDLSDRYALFAEFSMSDYFDILDYDAGDSEPKTAIINGIVHRIISEYSDMLNDVIENEYKEPEAVID